MSSCKIANAILSKGFKLEIKTGDIRTLRDGAWLNDEVINFYGELIMDRAIRNSEKHPPVHCFNTHFYPTVKNGYQSVRRWTRRVDLFSKDLIIVPVHLGNHWTCAVINFRRKRFEYYDSLHGTNTKVFPLLRSYITQESLDKRKQPLSLEGWTNYAPTDIPFQLNGNDCGVFTCVFMEYSARQAPFDFDGNHMSYFRQRIICEILEKKLLVE
ncbi:hypothetical protein BC832DRAFT_571405 [Gaertneriomyces semiglobifer]|nr:hypothetical protein BC832DRAFT_571405 [Gaertneriomyces semiglobifer]